MPGATLLTLLALLVVLSAVPSPAHGDIPTLMDNGNSSRTVMWNMTDVTSGLTPRNVTTAGGLAVLPWASRSLAWNAPSDFEANGTLGPGMTQDSSGIGLWGNSSSSVSDGDFADPGNWVYANGSQGNVVSRWDGSAQVAVLNHTSPANQTLWDDMDNVLSGNWVVNPPIATLNENTTGMKQGTGMMGIRVASWPGNYVGVVRFSSSSLDWSMFDRLVLWIKLNQNLSLGFNVTAVRGSPERTVGTVNESLHAGWQEVTVDLTQLGNASERAALSQVTLRFNGAGVPGGTWIDVDDVRLGVAKDFGEVASVSQAFAKANVTTPQPGSARLSFDWSLRTATGLVDYEASVNVTSGAGSSFEEELASTTPGTWCPFAADLSPNVTAAGAYDLSFRLRVRVNTTSASNISLAVDNVSFVFPDRHNATYLSSPLTLGTDSDYLALSWNATIPANTSISLGIRTSNSSSPNLGAWSDWQTFAAPATYSLTVPGAFYFQIRANLGTVNASRTPVLQSLGLATQHRVPLGSVVSDVYPAADDFLTWATFNATIAAPPLTSVAFFVGNGSDWRQVTPGAEISFIEGPHFAWKAVLATSDGLVTPSIRDVRVTYEYLGRPARVQVFLDGNPLEPGATVNVSVGQYLHFSGFAVDAGSHVLPSAVAPLIWESNDTQGNIFRNGTYLAGSPGLHWVNVTVSGYLVFASVRVNVSGQVVQPVVSSIWDLWPLYAVAIAAVLGFGVYELFIRRMFAIDDVFLIAKDGRLIVHNTRRMRADRDEDILSGMLTAITSFLRDQDPEENGELKRFEVGGKTTLLERGRNVYLTAIYSGRVPGWAGKDLHRFMRDLEARFGDAFAHWTGSPEDLHGLKEFMGRFVTRSRYRGLRGRAG